MVMTIGNPNGGYIRLYRSLIDWKFYGDPIAMALWVHILLEANWQEKWWRGIQIDRGSFITSEVKLAEELQISRNTVRKWLKRFESDGQISIESTNKFTRINVINYSNFQDQEAEREHQDEHQSEQQSEHQGEHQSEHNIKKKRNKEINTNTKRFSVPNIEEVRQYITENHLNVNADRFYDYYSANGWKVGRSPMKDWRASCRYWSRNETKPTKEMPEYISQPQTTETASAQDLEEVRRMMEAMK